VLREKKERLSPMGRLSDLKARIYVPTLLALRHCTRADSTKAARLIETHPSTVRDRIQALRDQEIVRGYAPVVDPTSFGLPYLFCIDVDASEYRLPEDADKTVEGLCEFFHEGIGHAPLSFYVYYEGDSQRCVRCVTMTYDVERVIGDICHQQNIARENISVLELEMAEGIPNYNDRSLPELASGVGDD
jgi:DNA-binding Lrp family transcriptional regulator